MKKDVLGVKVDDISLEEAVTRLCHPELDSGSRLVFTTGPEFIVTAQSDPEFKNILNAADLNIPDGVGLKLFCGFKNSFAGVDLMLELCKAAAGQGLSIGLFGGQEGVAKKTAGVLEQKFKGLKVKFAVDGESANVILKTPAAAVGRSGSLKPVDFLFVGLGHPKQEKFLEMLKQVQHDIFRVGMGVGGSFDFIAGNLPRPPEFVRKLGLGWLYRGFTKPGHWRRIINAVVVFPLLVIWKPLQGKLHRH